MFSGLYEIVRKVCFIIIKDFMVDERFGLSVSQYTILRYMLKYLNTSVYCVQTPTFPMNVFTGCSKQIMFYCGEFKVRFVCNGKISKRVTLIRMSNIEFLD